MAEYTGMHKILQPLWILMKVLVHKVKHIVTILLLNEWLFFAKSASGEIWAVEWMLKNRVALASQFEPDSEFSVFHCQKCWNENIILFTGYI